MIQRIFILILGLTASVWAGNARAQATSGPAQPQPVTTTPAQPAAPTVPAANRPYMLHGQVLDAAGQPLPGATVMIKGTRRIHATNADGYYAIAAYQPSLTLLISLAGYTETALAVQHGEPVAVTLEPLPGTRIRQGGRHHGKIIAVRQSGE